MTLTELKYIIVLAQEKHFGRAAKVCHITQPTLSIALNKLEAELGVSLFERDKNVVRLTTVGEKIVNQAQITLDEAKKIELLALSGRSEIDQPLKLGAIYTIAPYLFPSLIPSLKSQAPDMSLIIHEDYTANLKNKLVQGEVDAILVALPFQAPGISVEPLYDESFVVLMRKEHELSRQKKIKTTDLLANELLLLGEGHCFRDQVLEACPHCYSDGTSIQATSIETLRHMVASGLGITILPITATHIEFYKSILCVKPFAEKIPQRRIALVWRNSFVRPQAIKKLIQAIKSSSLPHIEFLS